MEKIKDMMQGGQKKEGDAAHQPATTTTEAGYREPGYGQPGTTTAQPEGEKHGFMGLGGRKKEGAGGEKKPGMMGMGGDSPSSSDEEREGARERNRIRREKRGQRQAGVAGTNVPVEGTGEKKHGFFG